MNATRGAHSEYCTSAPGAVCALTAMIALCLAGCANHIARISSARDAVPVQQLPAELLTESRPADAPIDFRLLEQRAPETHVIDAGDLLGIIVQGVLPASDGELPKISTSNLSGQLVYPATGQIHGPVVGVPMYVSMEGSLAMPLVGSLPMRGLTLRQAAEAIRRAYVIDHKILVAGRDTVIVTLIKPRVHRVLVIREDIATGGNPSYVWRGAVPYTKLAPSLIIDLPTHQNDVLHALVASGGLPGIDAHSELWVLRGRADAALPLPPVEAGAAGETLPPHTAKTWSSRIPLRVRAGEPLAFQEEDILLGDGDIVFVPSRDGEVFYTGGLLPGGRFPLPRDRSLDVIAAMAMANGAVGGPAGLNGVNGLFSHIGLGGIVYPTRILVMRKLPSGEHVKIAVDLSRAATDTRERLIIQPNDLIMLQYKPTECVANAVLSMVFPIGLLEKSVTTPTSAAVASTTASSAGGAVVPPPVGTEGSSVPVEATSP